MLRQADGASWKRDFGKRRQDRPENGCGDIFRRRAFEKVNAIIHPAVKTYILDEMEKERQAGEKDVFFLEAALLIEEGYDKLLDELWYIYADEDTRRKRLMEDRGYPPEKVERIFKSQLSEEEFLAHCKVVIDNSRDLGDTYRQIDERLKEAGLIK
ncbi:MAG: dephospho-CoA kinase [Eisenbergiella sp.]